MEDGILAALVDTFRVLIVTIYGVDLFFYAMHCMSHLPWTYEGKNDWLLYASRLQSMLVLVIIPVDFILLVQDNRYTSFWHFR